METATFDYKTSAFLKFDTISQCVDQISFCKTCVTQCPEASQTWDITGLKEVPYSTNKLVTKPFY